MDFLEAGSRLFPKHAHHQVLWRLAFDPFLNDEYFARARAVVSGQRRDLQRQAGMGAVGPEHLRDGACRGLPSRALSVHRPHTVLSHGIGILSGEAQQDMLVGGGDVGVDALDVDVANIAGVGPVDDEDLAVWSGQGGVGGAEETANHAGVAEEVVWVVGLCGPPALPPRRVDVLLLQLDPPRLGAGVLAGGGHNGPVAPRRRSVALQAGLDDARPRPENAKRAVAVKVGVEAEQAGAGWSLFQSCLFSR